jgi:sensor domain CHASE-containing protein
LHTEPTLDISQFLTLAVPAVAVGVWLIRLEGRINVHQALHQKLSEDVAYIRDRIDRALNGHQ